MSRPMLVFSFGFHWMAPVSPRRSCSRSCCSMFISAGMRTSESLKRPGVAYRSRIQRGVRGGIRPVCAAIAAGFCTPLVAVVPANEVPVGSGEAGARRLRACPQRSNRDIRSRTGRPAACSDRPRKYARCRRPKTKRRPCRRTIGRNQRGDARVVRAAVFVIRIFHRQRELGALVVERLAGHEVDGGAERTFVRGCRGRLGDLQRSEEVRSKYVEIEAAAAVGRSARIAGSGRGERLEAVEAHAREIAAESAHRDAATFAVVAVERDAGQALQGLCEVGVGEVGDVFGVDGVHHHGRRFSSGRSRCAATDGNRLPRWCQCPRPASAALVAWASVASVAGAVLILVGCRRTRSNAERSEHHRQNALGAI